MGMLSNLAAKYWFVCGIGVSMLWFFAGKQYLSKGQPVAAIGRQSVAVIIALIVCGGSAAEREWLGLAAGIVAVYFEVRSIRRSTLNKQR